MIKQRPIVVRQWKDGGLTMLALDSASRWVPLHLAAMFPTHAAAELAVSRQGHGAYNITTPQTAYWKRMCARSRELYR